MKTNNRAEDRVVLDVHEAAKTLRVGPATVRRLVREEHLQRLPSVRKFLIPATSIQAFIQAR